MVCCPIVLQVANLQNGICTASPMNSINALELTLPSSSGQGGEGPANATSTTTGTGTPALDDIPGSCNPEGDLTQTVVSVHELSWCLVQDFTRRVARPVYFPCRSLR